MSLEAAIHENTAAIRELIARLTAAGMTQQAAVGTIVHQAIEESFSKPAPAAQKKTPEAKKSENAPSSGSTNESPASAAQSATGASPPVTYEDAKKALLNLSKEKGREAAVTLLQRFGVQKGPDLKPAQWAEFIKDAEAVIAGTYDPEEAELA